MKFEELIFSDQRLEFSQLIQKKTILNSAQFNLAIKIGLLSNDLSNFKNNLSHSFPMVFL